MMNRSINRAHENSVWSRRHESIVAQSQAQRINLVLAPDSSFAKKPWDETIRFHDIAGAIDHTGR
jgi:hypothetical protein